ncbi:uncharacterized protein CDAR_61881 [Caerostris darwini]|uniref:Cell death regulator Aven n=1 Tax=Caerostris darwini TaxID=1538125 RepID=A0AAV4VJJ6_9ARAC|nr:uncharacterized protein CDAR_61881 [Caerostris darwini]
MKRSEVVFNLPATQTMAPGPKRKNFNRRGGENLQENKIKPNTESQTKNNDAKSTLPDVNEDNLIQDKRYSKRSVTSNWTKYDEPINDPHADTTRGKDFEVLLSYAGGSQLQLQDEKEWDEVCINDKSLSLDLKNLACILKCIPFHKRMNLPEDIFDDTQLKKFTSYAENWKSSYTSEDELPTFSEPEEIIKKPEIMDSNLNIIESYESDLTNELDVKTKPLVLEEKTENIIESLASCLSLKSSIPEKVVDIQKKNIDNTSDDLDFLLSLSKSSITLKQEKPSIEKQTNVDDWLNSILDD